MNNYKINDKVYNVVIVRKKILNTYIRVKNTDTIYITTGYFTTNMYLKKLLDKNINQITKMFEHNIDRTNYYLGQYYKIVYNSKDNISDCIYTKDSVTLEKLYRKKAKEIFENRLNYNYELFTERIPYPTLYIRNMKGKWGVCNRRLNKITLNLQLIHYDIDVIDYVIIHELSHFIQPNHSKKFYNVVSKYCSNYKISQKKLKE